MSISWAQGLLAGAAGVAEYSASEQKMRQAKIDRTTELKNQMAIHQAKSRYATKIVAYEENRKILKAVGGTEVGSRAEQLALYKANGFTITEASAEMAAGAIPLKRPEAMKEPMMSAAKLKESDRAESPLQGWARSFRESMRGENTEEAAPTEVASEEEPQEATIVPEAPVAPLVAAPVAGTPPVEEEVPVEAATPLEPVTAVEGVPLEAGEVPAGFDPHAKVVKDKITLKAGVQNGVNGSFVLREDADGNVTQGDFLPNGIKAKSTLVPSTRRVVALPDGSEKTIEMFEDTITGKLTPGQSWISKIAKPGEPKRVEMLKQQQSVSEYVKEDTGNFVADFSESAGWTDGFNFNAGLDNKLALANNYRTLKQAAWGDGILEENFHNDVFMNEMKDRIKAMAYTRTLQNEDIIKGLKDGDVPLQIFLNPKFKSTKSGAILHSMIMLDKDLSKKVIGSPTYEVPEAKK